jgi:hypothetical protein
MSVAYTIGGIADSVAVNFGAIDVTDAAAVATAVAAALDAKAGISAVSAAGVITVSGDSGDELTISTVTPAGATTLAGAISNGTDQTQVSTLTVSGTPTTGDLYSIIVGGIGGGDAASAVADATPTTDEIASALSTDYTTAEISDAVVGSVITFTDSNADNGGFDFDLDTTAAFAGSGASDIGATALNLADVITDFNTVEDTISFGLVAGNGTNYAEAAAAADYVTALANADTAFNGTVQYYLTSSTADTTGLLFFDANLDGNVDGVVSLTGIDMNNFDAADIVA